MNALAKTSSGEILETVMVKGDLSRLTPDERNRYYLKMCETIGLNPVTRPLEYITLSGKLVLYARKDCTDQLRAMHKISVTDLAESERDGVFIVTAKVSNAEGRTDISKGAVNIANMKGEALANALMKAETKAKRRATLSICGLGLLDETEVEDANRDIASQPPNQVIAAPESVKDGTALPHKIPAGKDMSPDAWADQYIAYQSKALTGKEIGEWDQLNDKLLGELHAKHHPIYRRIEIAVEKRKLELDIKPPVPKQSLSGTPRQAAPLPAEPPHDPETGEVVWEDPPGEPLENTRMGPRDDGPAPSSARAQMERVTRT